MSHVAQARFERHRPFAGLHRAETNVRDSEVTLFICKTSRGISDPRTTLTYIRTRDRLSKPTAYVVRY